MTDPKLTDIQTEVLEAVKNRPGLTVEDYANDFGNTQEVYSAFGYLIYQAQMLKLNEANASVTTKGII